MATADQEDSSLTQSITDLMVSLFVIFVLLLVHYINRQYQETRQQTQSVKQVLMLSLNKEHIAATEDPLDPLALLITVRDDTLQFDRDRSTLKPAGKGFLSWFVPRLATVLSSKGFNNDIASIVIEGHTDSDGIDEHNLRLSQDRSYQVLLFALNEANLNTTQRNFFLDKVSANGRGRRVLLPLGSKPGFENKSQSRRVEFKIRIKSFEQKQAVAQRPAKPSKGQLAPNQDVVREFQSSLRGPKNSAEMRRE